MRKIAPCVGFGTDSTMTPMGDVVGRINDWPEWEPKHLRIFPDLTPRSGNHRPGRMDRQARRCQHLAEYVLRHLEETVGRLRLGCSRSRARQSIRTGTLPKHRWVHRRAPLELS